MDKFILLFPITIIFPIGLVVAGIGVSVIEVYLIFFTLFFSLYYLSLIRKGILNIPFTLSIANIVIILFLFSSYISILRNGSLDSEKILYTIRCLEIIILAIFLPNFFKFSNITKSKITSFFLFSVFLAVIFAFMQFIFKIGTIDIDGRIFGYKMGPAFGGVLSTAIIILFLKFRLNLKYRIFILLLILFVFVAIFTTLTRTWIITPLLTISIYYLFRINFFKFLKYLPLLILPFFFFKNIKSDNKQIQKLSTLADISELSKNPRFLKWGGSLIVFLQKPLFGVGPYNLAKNNKPFLPKFWTDANRKLSDNTYLDLLSMHGIIGTSTFFLFNIILLHKNRLNLFGLLQINWLLAGFFWNIIYNFAGLFFFYILIVGSVYSELED